MRKRTSPASSRTNEIEDGTPSNASTNWVMAGLFIVLAAGAYAYFRPPLDFDFNSRDFNPFVFVPLGFLAIALSSLVPAVRGTLMARRFGKTVFAMEGDDVELGGTLKGVIRCSVDLAPTADYVVTVQCVDTITTSSGSDQKRHTREVPGRGSRGPLSGSRGHPLLAELARRITTHRNRRHLEAIPVVSLEHPRHQVRHRVIMEVGGNVSQPYAVVPVLRSPPQLGFTGGMPVAYMRYRA